MVISSFKRLTFYANGNLGKSSLASLIEIYGLFYFTDILGISPEIAGMILLITLIWDAISDPLVGHLGDKSREKWSTLVPFAMIGLPLTAIAFLLLFHLSAMPTETMVLGSIVCMIAFRTAYTIFDVPHNSLLAVITDLPEERTIAASLRIFFSSLGKVLVTGVVAWIVSKTGSDKLDANRFVIAAYFLVGIFIVSTVLCCWHVRKIKLSRIPDLTSSPRLSDILRMVLRDRQIATIFALTSLNSLSVPVIGAGLIYIGKYGLENEIIGAKTVTFLAIAQTGSLLFWALLTNWVKSKPLVCIIAYFLLFLTTSFGIGSGYLFPSSQNELLAIGMMTGFSVGGIFMLNWSMLPDALDEYRNRSGKYGDLGVFGVYTLANKGFHGLSQAYMGGMLAIVGFSANAAPSSFSADHIRLAIFGLPCICAAMSMFLLWRIK